MEFRFCFLRKGYGLWNFSGSRRFEGVGVSGGRGQGADTGCFIYPTIQHIRAGGVSPRSAGCVIRLGHGWKRIVRVTTDQKRPIMSRCSTRRALIRGHPLDPCSSVSHRLGEAASIRAVSRAGGVSPRSAGCVTRLGHGSKRDRTGHHGSEKTNRESFSTWRALIRGNPLDQCSSVSHRFGGPQSPSRGPENAGRKNFFAPSGFSTCVRLAVG